MDRLLARLSEQQAVLSQQNEALSLLEDDPSTRLRVPDHASSTNSLPITPATEGFSSTAPSTRPASVTLDESRSESDEVLRLKLQLAQAQNKISKLDQELAHSRSFNTEAEPQPVITGRATSAAAVRDSTWATTDDAGSDTSDAMSATAFNRTRGIWGNAKGSFATSNTQPSGNEPQPGTWFGGRGFNLGCSDANNAYSMVEGYRSDRLSPDADMSMRHPANRRVNRYDPRANNHHQFNNVGYNAMNNAVAQFDAMSGLPISTGSLTVPPGLGSMNMAGYPAYQQQPAGTPLSPHASEFTSKTNWKPEVCNPLLQFLSVDN